MAHHFRESYSAVLERRGWCRAIRSFGADALKKLECAKTDSEFIDRLKRALKVKTALKTPMAKPRTTLSLIMQIAK